MQWNVKDPYLRGVLSLNMNGFTFPMHLHYLYAHALLKVEERNETISKAGR